MYAVRDITTHMILFADSSTAFSGLDGKAIYPEFDAKTMELGWTSATTFPATRQATPKAKTQPKAKTTTKQKS